MVISGPLIRDDRDAAAVPARNFARFRGVLVVRGGPNRLAKLRMIMENLEFSCDHS